MSAYVPAMNPQKIQELREWREHMETIGYAGMDGPERGGRDLFAVIDALLSEIDALENHVENWEAWI